MYLLVFVTLVVSLINIYAQVLAVQTARIYANQNGVAAAMLQWHSAAISMAASVTSKNPGGYGPVAAIGCSLTSNLPPVAGTTTFSQCPPPPLNGGVVDPKGTITGPIPAMPAYPTLYLVPNQAGVFNECVHLPASCTAPIPAAGGCALGNCVALYDTRKYQFYTALYKTNSQDFVVTFVMPPTITAANPAPGFVSLASGQQTGLTLSDFLQQLQHTGAPNYSYGTIKWMGGACNAASQGPQLVVAGSSTPYTLPWTFNCFSLTVGGIDGAVATIGSPDGF